MRKAKRCSSCTHVIGINGQQTWKKREHVQNQNDGDSFRDAGHLESSSWRTVKKSFTTQNVARTTFSYLPFFFWVDERRRGEDRNKIRAKRSSPGPRANNRGVAVSSSPPSARPRGFYRQSRSHSDTPKDPRFRRPKTS